MDDIALKIEKLTKHYGSFAALKSLDLSVKKGEIYGYLGPNGAGKSTTIRTVMNFIQPTSGHATILGMDIVRDSVAIKRRVGYLSSDMAMYPKLTGRQYLQYLSDLQGNVSSQYRSELMHRMKVEGGKRLGDLSRGNRQKFAIVQAFMHKPDMLVLDEPSSGLDPLMQAVFYELLREASARGAAIFMSSHFLGEVQKVCDRVGIIREGKLIAERSIAEMEQEAAHTLDVTFAGAPPLQELKHVKGVQISSHDERHVALYLKGNLPALLSILAHHNVTQLEVRQLDLEELFMHYYDGKEGK